ncbi:alpha/beta hydrolase family protein [Risungbinella massiliensis]|uniref:alpha/beta hydrolase family protein n=1 Tax=Risungbinella massiliensis TaxID=1329796 RepID=UPI0005CBB230|nr:carboxylic ester hydrolase [Risungbinella massiliensis]
MRFWEMSLIVINFSFLIWFVFGKRKGGWLSILFLSVAYSLVITQIAVEGGRWQMIPAYLTPLIMTLLSFVKKQTKNVRSRIKSTVQALLLTVYLLLSVTLPIVLPVFEFEKTTGPYLVGTTSYHWIDEKRSEDYTENPNDKRELMVQIWYPTDKPDPTTKTPYIQNVPEITEGLKRALSIPPTIFSHLGLVKTHAYLHANLSDSEKRFPVLIFSHGLTGFRNQNTFQVEELVSHGYIVIGIDHTFDAAATVYPDGRVASIKFANLSGFPKLDEHIQLWTDDVSFVLDQVDKINQNDPQGLFTGRIDIDRIGMFGHSYGGATAVQMLWKDARVKAAINMDGTLYGTPIPEKGLGKPFMQMHAEKSVDKKKYFETVDLAIKQTGKTRKEYENNWNEMGRRWKNALANGGVSLIIPHTSHMSFTDFHLFSPLLPNKNEQPRQVHQIINKFSLAFFDKHLKQGNVSILDKLKVQYPDVHFNVH